MEAKQAADTDPTYPNPKTLTDKPKRILLAIEYLGLVRSPKHYINPASERRQNGFSFVAVWSYTHSAIRFVSICYRKIIKKHRKSVWRLAAVDIYFHFGGNVMGPNCRKSMVARRAAAQSGLASGKGNKSNG